MSCNFTVLKFFIDTFVADKLKLNIKQKNLNMINIRLQLVNETYTIKRDVTSLPDIVKRIFIVMTVILLLSCFFSCSKESDDRNSTIDNISFENYPRVDGSTSTQPLSTMIACKLLKISCEWTPGILEYRMMPDREEIPEGYSDFFNERIKVSQTHGAFMNLIEGNTDIILTHRTISPYEKERADELGITLIETPIALDAFVFVVNKENPVRNLTVDQVQRIYTEEIINWQQVGGNDVAIIPFTRPRNSGSEEIMRSLVMGGLLMGDFPESEISTMAGVFPELRDNDGGFCYTFDFYKEFMVRTTDENVPKISINGVFPNENTIRNGTYPFISEVNVAIRSDLNQNSMAYKLYQWLQTEGARSAISETGYIPKLD